MDLIFTSYASQRETGRERERESEGETQRERKREPGATLHLPLSSKKGTSQLVLTKVS